MIVLAGPNGQAGSLPILYELDHKQEYIAIRTSCAAFDTSPLYKYDIHGPDALRLMNRVVTQDVARCAVGQSMYTPWCDDEGKIIDDGILSRLQENFFRLTSADPTLIWLEDNAMGLDATVEDITDAFAILSIQGPYSRALLKMLADADFDHLRYFRLLNTSISGIPVTVSRTGFTGDLGYEIWVEPHRAVELWDVIFEAGETYRLRPFGEKALNMARIEAGYLLTNVDFTSAKKALYDFEKSSPFEIGLGWTVKLNKEYFIGQQALIKEKGTRSGLDDCWLRSQSQIIGSHFRRIRNAPLFALRFMEYQRSRLFWRAPSWEGDQRNLVTNAQEIYRHKPT